MALDKSNSGKPSLLSQWKKRKKPSAVKGIGPRPKDAALSLSYGQQRLWLLQQLYPDNPFYQYGHLYQIKGSLDVALLRQSFQHLLQRHELLRCRFVQKELGASVELIDSPDFIFEEKDMSQEAEAPQRARELALEFVLQAYDLSQGPLIKAQVLHLSEDEHHLVLGMHHIIGDRWSLEILQKELFAIYQSLRSGAAPPLSPLKIQYTDFAHWQKSQSIEQSHLDYWLQQLSGELPILQIPSDFKRPAKASFSGKTIHRLLSPTLSDRIRQMAKAHSSTPYAFLLAAFKVLLFRHSQQEDILVGSPFINRDKPELEGLIGFFNETLVLRSQLSNKQNFRELIQQVKETTLSAFAHKQVPFDRLVRELQPERHGSANPLFQAMFLYNKQGASLNPSDLPFQVREEMIDLGVSKFDLTLFATETDKGIELSLEFALDLWKSSSAERLLDQMEVILEAVCQHPDQAIGQIPLLVEKERKKLLEDWNATEWEMPAYANIHQLIEEMGGKHGDEWAVVDPQNKLSYAQLNQGANAIAAQLVALGLQKNEVIGLYARRSVDMIMGMVGILKAGAAYLPLDPEYPAERIEYMLTDSGARILLTQADLLEQVQFSQSQKVVIEEASQEPLPVDWQAPMVESDQLAYIIYTSGSTGKPKGVPIQHDNLLHSTCSRFAFYPSNPSSFLLLSSFSFDSSVVGIFWTLCTGGKLVLPPKRIEQDVLQLGRLIEQEQVSHTLMLPSLYGMILNHVPLQQVRSLRNVMVAGEACPFPLINKHYRLLPKTELYNEYGPTEASVWCIAHLIRPDESQFVPIGKAIPNATAYILDEYMEPRPIGVPGELYIGGLGLSKGYLHRPELTAGRFLKHPFSSNPNDRVYKTGDLARFHEDGLIEFLGRVDHQVKIRGFRVEPDEIQQVILRYEGCEEALVKVHQSQGANQTVQQQLVAYVVGLEEAKLGDLRYDLQQQLPEYMVPSAIIPLKDFPRLPNGKINHKALPQPTALSTTTNTDYAPPQGALEEQLTQIWEATLAHRPIGRQDNFFAIGGDSILSIQIVAKAREAGIDLAPDQLFDHQTIADLARSVTQSAAASQLVEVDLPKINRYPLSHLQQAFLFNSQQEGEDQGILHLTFYLEGSIDEALFQKAWALCMQRHDAMRSYVDRSEKGLAVQVIAESADLTWTTIDWRELSGSAREEALQKLQNETQAALSLSEAPVSQLQLIQLDQEEYLLHWTCHHLFLDGWSCGLILKDALQYYDALYQGKSLSLKALPNYLNYLDWRAQQDTEEAQAFWQKQLAGLSEVLHFPVRAQTSAFVDLQSVIDQETTQRLMAYCQEGQVSLSTLFQGIWVLLLGRRFDHQEVVFGKTVSGRFNAFPQIDAISGLFMNVVPDRIAIPAQTTFGNWLQSLQKAQGQKNKYDHIPQEQIQQWSQWPSTIDLFESLFLFGNFLQEQSAIGPIAIKRFEGGFSSTYPLTIRIKPGQQILINWRYDQQRVDDDTLQWFNEQLLAFCRALQSNTLAQNLESLWQHIPMPFAPLPTRNISDLGPAITPEAQHYVPPRTLLEQQLCTIWEELFQRQPIGIEDHFFDLGGRSMLALQLFARIEQEMGEVLPPATLFQHPTIAGLARMMNQDGKEGSSVLVPLRAQGEQQPLFCLHGGGAHVFFYQALTKYLPAELPVYSIQPPGLDGNREFHQSIEEMAAEYIQEIKTVQAQGPYRILGTCFSNAVALEMARQLEAAGEKIDPLLIIDSGPLHLFGDDPQGKSKTLRRFYDLVKHGDLSRIKRKIANRLMAKKAAVPQTPVEAESSSGRHLRLMIESLNKLYAQYHWQPIEGAIHFIRSTEFEQREDKQYQVGQWTKLAKGGLSIAVVQGHHKTLFEEPEVQGLSEQVADYLVG